MKHRAVLDRDDCRGRCLLGGSRHLLGQMPALDMGYQCLLVIRWYSSIAGL